MSLIQENEKGEPQDDKLCESDRLLFDRLLKEVSENERNSLLRYTKEPKSFLSDEENQDRYFPYLEYFFEREKDMDVLIRKETDKLKRLSKPVSVFDWESQREHTQMKKKFYQDCQRFLEEEVKSRRQLEQVERFLKTYWKGDIIK